jgi:predicted nucleic acid-binding protein
MSFRLILDAGPLYALAAPKDVAHADAQRGFTQLAQENVDLIAPLPIIFEVFKLLCYRDSPQVARAVLMRMMTMTIVLVGLAETEAIATFLGQIPTWGGSLEDASVILLAQKLKCPGLDTQLPRLWLVSKS